MKSFQKGNPNKDNFFLVERIESAQGYDLGHGVRKTPQIRPLHEKVCSKYVFKGEVLGGDFRS